MSNLTESIEEFVKEKRFLLNVSPRTLEWYDNAFKWLKKYCPEEITW
jgi:hypothetical protein